MKAEVEEAAVVVTGELVEVEVAKVVEDAAVDEAVVAMQEQAELTRLLTFPVQAAAYAEGTVAEAEVKVPQNALASAICAGARRARRQLSALQLCAVAQAIPPKAMMLEVNFMIDD